jgi:hypothetical protein
MSADRPARTLRPVWLPPTWALVALFPVGALLVAWADFDGDGVLGAEARVRFSRIHDRWALGYTGLPPLVRVGGPPPTKRHSFGTWVSGPYQTVRREWGPVSYMICDVAQCPPTTGVADRVRRCRRTCGASTRSG